MTCKLVPFVVLAVLGVGSSLWRTASAGYDALDLSNQLEAGGSVGSRSARQNEQRTPDDGRRRAADASALYCHTCSSSKHGDQCSHLASNSSTFSSLCPANQTVCMVKRFSVTENATAPSVLWSIERNCSSKCEPGCLVLGERTKIHVCVSCCTQHSCNIGNGSDGRTLTSRWITPAAQLALFAIFSLLS